MQKLLQEIRPASTPGTDSPTLSKPTPQLRRSNAIPLAIVSTMASGVFLALAGLIVVAAGHGRIVVESQVEDVQVVVTKNGEEITTIDLTTGSQVRWLSTGKYELNLIGDDNGVQLDKTGFEVTRLGKVIVTARWSSAGSVAIRSFTTSDEPIMRDGVSVDEGGWKITAGGTRNVRLFELPMPEMEMGPYFYRAKLKSENVKGRAYLEMWSRFPGEGEFFSKGFEHAIRGTNGWAEYEVPFYLKKGQQPDLVKLNLTLEGGGTVWIKDVELRGRVPDGSSSADAPATPIPSAPDPAGANLILDPTFENTLLPRAWRAWLNDGPEFRCEVVAGGRTGQRCLQISGTGTRGVVFGNEVKADRSKRYALKGGAKFEGDRAARAIIKFNYLRGSEFLVGQRTFGWRRRGREFFSA